MFHTSTVEEVLRKLGSNQELGLLEKNVEQKFVSIGPNELPEPKKEPLILKFLDEFRDVIVLLLIAATAVSFFLGETVDAIAIITIVFINAILGFTQEYKAEKAIEALKKMSAAFCKVLREGKLTKIESKYLVPGDIIIIEEGDKIPADARIIEAVNLEVSEAILTGESVPVKKFSGRLDREDLPVSDRKNMLFKDTSVTFGRGKAVVCATGPATEVGKISSLLGAEKTPETPLQIELEKVGKNLSFAAIFIIFFIFLAEIFLDNQGTREAFLSSVSLAVAAIPEGLPAVITIVLAVGVSRLAKKKAIIRRLPAVETLGATTHILTDKTGTLTQNRMVVTRIVTPQAEYTVEGEGYKPEGNFYDQNKNKVGPRDHLGLMKILKTGVYCCNAEVNFSEEKNAWVIVGDITEGALVVAAKKAKIDDEAVRKEKRLFEIPFSSDEKFMLTAYENKEDKSKADVYVKGAPEAVIKATSLSQEEKSKFSQKADALAGEGLRSLGFAIKTIPKSDLPTDYKDRSLLNNLEFAGLMAQKDPLRPEVKSAVEEAAKAGVTTIMVTGDHKLTAMAIGKDLGIISLEEEAMSGDELAKKPPEEVDELIKKIKVYARVSPEQKLQLVKAFKKMGCVVAVTGDGVNDAPALKASNIGVAMGIEGTDVAKEAASMVLQNDNYATIVSAIKEGRIIFDNLIKFITYLISCNISEILIIFAGAFMRLPIPLLPIHLLWINLVTDGFPALALGMEPGESDIMQRKPRETREGVLTKGRWVAMSLEGLFMGSLAFAVFYYSLSAFGLDHARTVTFATLSFLQFMQSLNNRSEKQSLFKVGITGNKFLMFTIIISIFAHIPILYSGVGELLFNAVPLGLNELVLIPFSGFVFIAYVEFLKFVKRQAAKAQTTN